MSAIFTLIAIGGVGVLVWALWWWLEVYMPRKHMREAIQQVGHWSEPLPPSPDYGYQPEARMGAGPIQPPPRHP